MKAVLRTNYGPPEELQLAEVDSLCRVIIAV